jgi:hypothetical protein
LLKKAEDYCTVSGADRTTYIAAQMWMLFDAPQVEQYGFQPNLLLGEKAKARYNIFLRRAHRRFRRGYYDVYNERTLAGVLRRTLYEDEFEVGSYYVRLHMLGESPAWKDVVLDCNPSWDWRVLDDRSNMTHAYKARRRNLEREFYPALLHATKRLVVLQAAHDVVEMLCSGLSEWLGYHEPFSWYGLAYFLRNQFADVKPKARGDLSNVPGKEWGIE